MKMNLPVQQEPTPGKEWDSTFSALSRKVGRRERGSITAELAIVLPAVLILLAAILLAVSAGLMQLKLEESARSAARSMARGDSSAQAVQTARRIGGDDIDVSVETGNGYVTVVTTGKVKGALAALVPWTQSARATAKFENVAAEVHTWLKAGGHGIT